MQFNVPDELREVFWEFINVSQSAFSEQEVSKMSDKEQECLKFIENLLGDKAYSRFETTDSKKSAAAALDIILSV